MLVIEAKGALQENNITTYNIDHIELVLIRPANPLTIMLSTTQIKEHLILYRKNYLTVLYQIRSCACVEY